MDIEKEIDYGSARSFPGLNPPNDAVEIERRKLGDNTYIYYQDADGKLYYNTTRGIQFELEMQERQKVRKIRKRME